SDHGEPQPEPGGGGVHQPGDERGCLQCGEHTGHHFADPDLHRLIGTEKHLGHVVVGAVGAAGERTERDLRAGGELAHHRRHGEVHVGETDVQVASAGAVHGGHRVPAHTTGHRVVGDGAAE